MNELEPPYGLIAEKLNDGRVIPFLGAGASLAGRPADYTWSEDGGAYLPTNDDLIERLVRKTTFPRAARPPELPTVAQYYSVVGGRPALDEWLHTIFDRDYTIGPIHEFLAAQQKPLLIVTTNYDDLIERAFRAVNRPFHLVVHSVGSKNVLLWHADANEPQVVLRNRLEASLGADSIIYKMHGAVDRLDQTRDQYVITEDDYVDFLTLVTKGSPLPALFARPFQDNHFLFLGYSLRDWNLRVVLNRIDRYRSGRKQITSWAIDRDPSPLETRFWQERNVEVYRVAIDDFVARLQAS